MKMESKYILIFIFIIIVLFFIIFILLSPTCNSSVMDLINGGRSIEYIDFANKYPRVNEDKPIYIIFHIATIGKWKSIVKEQMESLIESGLYDQCEGIYYGCNCAECPSKLKSFFSDKVKK